MWYDFFVGKTFRPWKQKEQEQAVVDLKMHMMRLEKRAPAYDVQGIDVVLGKMGFTVEVKRVQRLWSDLKRSKGIEVGHAMEALAENIADHVAFDQRRAVLSQLWPEASRHAIPDKNEEAIFDRVASLLGFADKNFLDSCIKHRTQRSWELSESDMYCVVAELLICMMWADGQKDLHENEHLCRIVGHGFQMDASLIARMFAKLDALDGGYSADHFKQSGQKIGLKQFEKERHAKIDALADLTGISKVDVERKFHVLIDVQQLDQDNLQRRIKLLVEKLRYSLDDYGYEHLLDELQDMIAVDGDVADAEGSLFAQVKTLLASAKRDIARK